MSAITEPGASAVSPPQAGGWCAPPHLLEQLYAKARAERWQLNPTQFAAALQCSVNHHFRGSNPSPGEVESYLRSLHLEDFALACGCAEGNEPAWEHFIREFRPVLYSAARAIAGQSNPHELADSIYAELYGLQTGEGKERKSLFRYFHGRSKLSTWLRAVLAQRHVDAMRASRRTESLEEGEATEASGVAPRAEFVSPPDPERARYLKLLQSALTAVLAALDPRDRLRLCYYYVQDLTLAQIGRLVGEHEATVSRKLGRTRCDLRKQVERMLRDPKGSSRLSEAQVQLCFQYAQEEWPFDLTSALSAGADPIRNASESEKQ